VSDTILFAGSNQPARRNFDITEVTIRGENVPVVTCDVISTSFFALKEFARADADAPRDVLVVAPLSGHFPILLRDVVVGLLPSFRVFVTDWINARYIPIEHGSFGLDANISCVVQMVRLLRPHLTVIALCQGGISALAAAALLGANDDPRTPSALVLIAAPINPLANQTRVARLLRARSLTWLENNTITKVPERFPGSGRLVYSEDLQLTALWNYLVRRIAERDQIWDKVLHDEGIDPQRFPFLDLYTSIMDLDASFFLENIKSVYHDCAMAQAMLRCQSEKVDLRAIRRTALLTVEGEWDDIAAPGQTSAAHDLCTSIPAKAHRSVVVPHCGHFSLFHGEIWRRAVLPSILAFSGFETLTGCRVVR